MLPLVFLTAMLSISCKRKTVPRPEGYHRIEFPEKSYQSFDTNCPFSFEYPLYGQVISDPNAKAKYWYTINFNDFKSHIYLTYYPINKDISKFIEDARTLAYKHTIKADAIDEEIISLPLSKVYGLYYHITGNAATPLNFFITDSTLHFLRGSLYFDVPPNKDSLAPVIEFLLKDIQHLVETTHWKN